MDSIEDLTSAVKVLARQLDFGRVGITSAGPVAHAAVFREWLARGCQAGMTYMESNLSKRLRPELLVPGACSVICLAVGYAPAGAQPRTDAAVARYARGRDYHKLLKRRCNKLMDRIRQIAPRFTGRAFVDTAPVMERNLAAAAGIGWIGRNGALIVPGLGSYVLLCQIICNLPLRPDGPLRSECKDCRACLEACPTGAFVGDRIVDAGRCISYLTIEHRGPIAREFWTLIGRRVFGCDACQEACPFNRNCPPSDPELLGDGTPLGGATIGKILAWGYEDWDAATRGSATRRVSYEMFTRNAIIAAGNSADASLAEPLRRLRQRSGQFQQLISWALERLAQRQ